MKTVFLILFLIWGFPLMKYRSEFRKIVYQTEDWKINIQPRFGKELKGLIGNVFPNDKAYLKARNFYRFYLIVYFVLMGLWRFS